MNTQTLRSADLAFVGGEPTSVALTWDGGSLTYAELDSEVTAEARRLGDTRRVEPLLMRNDAGSVIRLLGALRARHPVLLLGADDADRHDEIATRYAHADDLHPDLAVMLSTSGSTGSPKLVRLSHDNLTSNARSIVEYLKITPGDRAITSLPFHYCYGLSVLTSHLTAGAGVALTDLSVADECFWDLAIRSRATSFAGVPYTFDLLDNSGFIDRDLSHLRYITQAGGRMDPAQVANFAALGAERGFEFYVMYGQTEATARMAYLPPHLAAARPTAIGLPVPGGHFRLDPVGFDADTDIDQSMGELVYSGPNVMMGYAESAADLARGPELVELRTGDLGRQSDDGLWEVCGRLDRCVKVFGLRLDLGRLESGIEVPVAIVSVGDALHAFIDRPRETRRVHADLVSQTGLPAGAVHVHAVDALPSTVRGKTDYGTLRQFARRQTELSTADPDAAQSTVTAASLRDLYAAVLRRPDATVHDSFVDLGGDSLSFVEASVQLGSRLGHLPRGWQHLSAERLAGLARPQRSRRWPTTPIEIPVLLRAVAIVLIVVSHTDLWIVMGGAHVLLGVAGYSLARFTLHLPGRRERSDRLLAVTASVAVPASLWILVSGRLSGDYDLTTALFLNQFLGTDGWSLSWHFWFLELLVWSYLAVALAIRTPLIDRWQRGAPFASATIVLIAGLAARYLDTGVAAGGIDEYTIPVAFWCLALGWAAAEASTTLQRCVVASLALVGAAGFFPHDLQRQAVLIVGLLALLIPFAVPAPRVLVSVVRHVAHASLWIYLTHWQVYPKLEAAGHPVLAVALSLIVGLGAHRLQAAVRNRLAWAPGGERTVLQQTSPGRRRTRPAL